MEPTGVRAIACTLALALATSCATRAPGPGEPVASGPSLRVSDNGRFLVHRDGRPFFWLGDTAWRLFQRTVREDAANQPSIDRYFDARARQGFTVIQATIIPFQRGPNPYGHEAFVDDDFTRPRLGPGPRDDFWDHADYLVEAAEERGLHLALLPVWLNEIASDEHPLISDPEVAYRYGHFLGNRYGDEDHIIWVMGGDPHEEGRDVDNPKRLTMTRALAEGIADGVNGVDRFDESADWSTTLMSYHPKGGNHSSSEVLHGEPWLDFNMIQTTTRFQFANYETVARDYAKTPPKPTLDSEVAYENSLSLRRSEGQDRRLQPWDVRRAAYWNVFAGGFGHTYGHRSFIQWTRAGEDTGRGGDVPWFENLDAPGALQMRHLRQLMESRAFLTRIPDQALVVRHEGELEAVGTRDSEGSYAMVYLPTGAAVTVDLDRVAGDSVRASWFDPRDGSYRAIGEFPGQGTRRFVPPSSGDDNDWVLVLDAG